MTHSYVTYPASDPSALSSIAHIVPNETTLFTFGSDDNCLTSVPSHNCKLRVNHISYLLKGIITCMNWQDIMLRERTCSYSPSNDIILV